MRWYSKTKGKTNRSKKNGEKGKKRNDEKEKSEDINK
jgi:hypothetical protein